MAKKAMAKKEMAKKEMKQTLIIIGTGFIGNALIRHFSTSRIYRLKAIYHTTPPEQSAVPSSQRSAPEYFQGDLLDQGSLERVLSPGDIVINAAGQLKDDFEIFRQVNLEGVKNLIAAAKKKNVKKIIHLSSTLVYGDLGSASGPAFTEDTRPSPAEDYSRVKYESEQLFRGAAPLPIIILRIGNVYGEGGRGIINQIISSSQNDQPIFIHDHGEQRRDFIFISDVMRAVQASLLYAPSQSPDVLNICNSRAFTINEILSAVKKHIPLSFYYAKTTSPQLLCNVADNSKAKRLLHFSPTVSLSQGLSLLLGKEVSA